MEASAKARGGLEHPWASSHRSGFEFSPFFYCYALTSPSISLFVWLVADGWCWWLVLVCSERKIVLAGCWWLVCSERKVLLAGG
jgi:hypothetical protein